MCRILPFVLGFALLVPLPSAALAASPEPAGVVAVSDKMLRLHDAQVFCETQNGRLPRANESESVVGGDIHNAKDFLHDVKSVIPFGAPGDPWPNDWPTEEKFTGPFWTDTTIANQPGLLCIVAHREGHVAVMPHQADGYFRAICVSK